MACICVFFAKCREGRIKDALRQFSPIFIPFIGGAKWLIDAPLEK